MISHKPLKEMTLLFPYNAIQHREHQHKCYGRYKLYAKNHFDCTLTDQSQQLRHKCVSSQAMERDAWYRDSCLSCHSGFGDTTKAEAMRLFPILTSWQLIEAISCHSSLAQWSVGDKPSFQSHSLHISHEPDELASQDTGWRCQMVITVISTGTSAPPVFDKSSLAVRGEECFSLCPHKISLSSLNSNFLNQVLPKSH